MVSQRRHSFQIERSRVFLGTLSALALFFPFIVIIANNLSFRIPLTSEVGWVISVTALQAALSAIFSIAFGLIGAFGLLALDGRLSRFAEGVALLPNAGPVILLLLSVMKLFPWARGLTGIIFVHVLLNAGLLSVVFAEVIRTKLCGYAELAWVEGATARQFFRRVALPLLKPDLLLAFLFVFVLCFASFSVPLALGGSRASTIEVLIYQKIRVSGEWTAAIGLALLQTLTLIAFSFVLGRMRNETAAPTFRRIPFLIWKPGLIVPLFASLILVIGLLEGVIAGARRAFALPPLMAQLPSLLAGSVLVGFLAGLFTVVFLLLIAYVRPQGLFRKIVTAYAAPSSVLVGFSLLIVWRDLGFASYVKIALAMTLVTVPSFLRFRWTALLDSLEGQVTIARTFGAGPGLVFRKIVLPQVIRPAFFLGGLCGLWAWGDFSLSGVVAERTMTVAMAVNGLMESYRLDIATFLVWFVILGGFVTLGLFVGVGNVLGQKPQA